MPADKGVSNERAEIDAAIAVDEVIAKASKVRGRKAKTSDHQEAVIELSMLNPLAVETMVAGLKNAREAAAIFNDAIKAFSEKAGIQSSILRKFITARAGEAFEAKKRDAMQLSLLFEEIGE